MFHWALTMLWPHVNWFHLATHKFYELCIINPIHQMWKPGLREREMVGLSLHRCLWTAFRIWTEHIAAQLLVLLNSCPSLPLTFFNGQVDGTICTLLHWPLFLHASAHLQYAKGTGTLGKGILAAMCSSHGLPAEKWRSDFGSERWGSILLHVQETENAIELGTDVSVPVIVTPRTVLYHRSS